MAVKLVALDLDGTVFNSKKEITPATRLAIIEAASKGVLIVPDTGRTLIGIPEAVRSLPISHLITSNGAVTREMKTQNVIRASLLSKAEARFILKTAEAIREQGSDSGYRVELIMDGRGFITAGDFEKILRTVNSPYILQYFRHTRTVVTDLSEILFTGKAGAESVVITTSEDSAREALLSALSGYPGIHVMYSGAHGIEVGSGETDKGAALLDLSMSLGIRKEEILAIGDAENDLELLAASGIPVAMGNAAPRLKESAVFITEDNEHDGVALALKHFLNLT